MCELAHTQIGFNGTQRRQHAPDAARPGNDAARLSQIYAIQLCRYPAALGGHGDLCPSPNWEVVSVGGGSFIVAGMSPQEAQPYLGFRRDREPVPA